jgi:nucleoside-diphosphate-sugar epimerase
VRYAESKANGEKALTDANSPPELLTVAIAPHQVYGPRDNLFLPNLLEVRRGIARARERRRARRGRTHRRRGRDHRAAGLVRDARPPRCGAR